MQAPANWVRLQTDLAQQPAGAPLRWRPFSDSLVIARNICDARRVSRILPRETALLEQVNPLDAFLDEEDDLFGFDEDI
ncbi:hypothetical protein [Streptomyces pseudogriseolus]|uniref:hypothetical protein n=1 Tax=Streptomyces pseudogriseolus TaxID=36817 RepID=UPI003FA2A47B